MNDEIERIFSDNGLPDVAKQMQLAKLIANNPEIADQLEKVAGIISKLKAVNFAEITIKIGSGDETKRAEGQKQITPRVAGVKAKDLSTG